MARDLKAIRTERHSVDIFNWFEGQVEGYLWALLDQGVITSDERFMASESLRDLRSSWRVRP